MKLFLQISLAFVFAAPVSQLDAQQRRTVHVKPGFSTVIICPTPPELVTVGNSQQYSVQNSGNFILVKPLVNQGTTNMFIKAGADSYHLILTVSDKPDLEIRLLPQYIASKQALPANGGNKLNVTEDGASADVRLGAMKDLRPALRKARAILPSYIRTPRRYTYSIKDSNVILALDYMIQIDDKLFVLCTMINNSHIPYDIGYVRFKLIDRNRSLLFFKKKIKETELEPLREVYNQVVKARSSNRLLFIFDKQGFSDRSVLEIKCIEESGRRDLVLEVPGSYVE